MVNRQSRITVSELWIHPIKSLRGIRVHEANLEPRGLQHDRRMMIVDADGRFVSQREHAGLALVDVAKAPGGWNISAAGKGEVFVPGEQALESLEVTVWKSTLTAVRVDDEVDRWLSETIGFPARLVRMTGDSRRDINPDYAPEGSQVSFADGFPVLIAGQASLDHLNDRIRDGSVEGVSPSNPAPLEMRRFRPNIVIAGAGPHEEDNLPEIQIGQARLRSAKRCGRCIVTTINPETAESGQEPLRTLATYRKHDQSVDFGMNYVPVDLGLIRVGDAVLPEPMAPSPASSK